MSRRVDNLSRKACDREFGGEGWIKGMPRVELIKCFLENFGGKWESVFKKKSCRRLGGDGGYEW